MTSLTTKTAAKRPAAKKLADDKPTTRKAAPKQSTTGKLAADKPAKKKAAPKPPKPLTAKQVAAANAKDLHTALRDTLTDLSSSGSEYPPTLPRLFERAGKPIDAETLNALASPESGSYVQLSVKVAKDEPASYYADAIAFLPADADRIARSPLLLYRVLRRTQQLTAKADKKPSPNVFNRAALTKMVPALLVKLFGTALLEYTERSEMPAGIGMIRGRDPVFFLIEHAVLGARFPHGTEVPPSQPTAIPPPAPAARGALVEFERHFQIAFERLNMQSGNHNYVLLHDLRQALPGIPRSEFDARLNDLRRSKTFSLDSADGRHVRLTAEQLEAGVREASSLLVYVARR